MSSFEIVRHVRAKSELPKQAPLRANPRRAVALGAASCAIGFCLLGPLASTGHATDGGFFAQLFGGWGAPVAPYRPLVGHGLAPLPDPHFRPRRHMAHTPLSAARKRVVRARLAVAQTASMPMIGPQQPVTLMTDGTLRRGDAVMTATGVRIFRGAHRFPFSRADFQPLAVAGRIAHRGALVAIDGVSRTPLWSAAWRPSSPLVALPHAPRAAAAMDDADSAPLRS